MYWLFAFACSTPEPGHVVKAVVVEVTAADEVLLDHEAIPGFMEAMTMPFHVQDTSLLQGLEPGHKIQARLEIGPQGGFLTRIEITGKGPAPAVPIRAPGPIRVGQQLEATTIRYTNGTTGTIGRGQGHPIALAFIYTRCPMPDFCPATIAKFQALQEQIAPPIELLAITIDPDFDTDDVLNAYARDASAKPDRWRFARADDLNSLALSAGLTILPQGDEVMHSKRILLLDTQGKLLRRYDDLSFSIANAATLLGAR